MKRDGAQSDTNRRHWLHRACAPQKPRALRRPAESLRVDPLHGLDGASPALHHAIGMAAIAEMPVYRLAADHWHLIGCARRLDVTTAQLEAMGWTELMELHKWQPEASAMLN